MQFDPTTTGVDDAGHSPLVKDGHDLGYRCGGGHPPTRDNSFIRQRAANSPKVKCPLRSDIRKIGTIQRRLAWPLHKDDTLFQSGRPLGLNIYFCYVF